MTVQQAIKLGKEWYYDGLREICAQFLQIFTIPNDPNVYVLLAWRNCFQHLWWRLLKTNDNGKTFQLVCETPYEVADGGGGGLSNQWI
mgnify:FL=1